MTAWKNVEIGDFLTERTGRYKPDDSAIAGYRRLDKIDFSGKIHISDKPTKTDMILIQKGDFVISGINVAKGALTVYNDNEPLCATIHYSSYIFDSSKVDMEYFTYFVKSPVFHEMLKKQVKGGIKTEIKAKHLLSLIIAIPSLADQKKIVREISAKYKMVNALKKETANQREYAKLLRQNILQEAVEGKLTAEWRKIHPVQAGNPDFDAEALFVKIQEEKLQGKVVNSNHLAAITEEKMPFVIPEGWKWVRLGDVCESRLGKTLNNATDRGEMKPYLCSINVYWEGINLNSVKYAKFSPEEIKKYRLHRNDLLVCEGGDCGRTAIWNSAEEMYFQNALHRISFFGKISPFFFKNVMELYKANGNIENHSKGMGIKHLVQKELLSLTFPLPPFDEQKEIVRKTEYLLNIVAELENQIQECKALSEQLIFGILKDAFEE